MNASRKTFNFQVRRVTLVSVSDVDLTSIKTHVFMEVKVKSFQRLVGKSITFLFAVFAARFFTGEMNTVVSSPISK